MKKITAYTLCFCMLILLNACGHKDETYSEYGTDAPAEDMLIAVISTEEGAKDKGLNQEIYEACKDYCSNYDLPFEYYKPDDNSEDSLNEMVEAAISAGYNIIVFAGDDFAPTLIKESELHQKTKFIVLDMDEECILSETLGTKYDGNPSNWDASNYYSSYNVYYANYREEQAGYLAGYSSVMMGYKNLGYLGDETSVSSEKYGNGFVQGADDAAEELGKNNISVTYGYAGQSEGNKKLTSSIREWYDSGTEVVMTYGNVYTSVAEAASKTDSKIILTDFERSISVNKKYGKETVLTSAYKSYRYTLNTILSQIYKGKWHEYTGKVDYLGLITSEAPDKNFVQLSYENTLWTDSFGSDDYCKLISKIINEELVVSNNISAEPSAKYITVNYVGVLN